MADDYSDLTYSLAGLKRQNPFDKRRTAAYQMMQQGMDSSPVEHWAQGANRLAQAIAGGFMSRKVDQDEEKAVEKQQATLAAAMAEPDPQKRIALLSASNPDLGARLSGQLAVEQAKLQQQQAGLQTGGAQIAQGYGYGGGGGSRRRCWLAYCRHRVGRLRRSRPCRQCAGPARLRQVPSDGAEHWPLDAGGAGQGDDAAGVPAKPAGSGCGLQGQVRPVRPEVRPRGASRAWFAGEGGMNNPNAAT
jgi:hypothetical protein